MNAELVSLRRTSRGVGGIADRGVATTPEVDALLAGGAAVAVGVSGGKDSVAAAIATWAHLDATGQGKLVRGERGADITAAQLESFGADPLAGRTGEAALEWLRYWRDRLTTSLRHTGNHRYVWCLDKRRERELVPYGPRLPYPKVEIKAERGS